ncbi:EAL domain-containing protein [Pelagibacterium luteolum]|uniref:Cyclic-di-GMP phosphodiesterase, flagellum assembly factor TipF n=1 Tax=Pelagibacterium luteolum TaxID=440168 RepID=A0A1G7U2B7_9HYPH|nr:EAL domain-containing protein [Pelagibacterium luteolum]SDG40930.1 cyclic-di-GMP phosphodiesterase, flagellum assembly factor TipF [Pelagibacterium luteolum]
MAGTLVIPLIEARIRVQGLVYILMGLCGAGLGFAAYFLAGFTPIEAVLLAGAIFLGGALIEERAARRRAFRRLEKGVEEMARLLATDAKAGQVLSERVNALADLDLGPRLDVIEADMSVLGTVVRQVAEAVSELETAQQSGTIYQPTRVATPSSPETRRSPTIPLADVRRALDEGRLVHNVQPVLTLPQRKLHANDLIPRLDIDGRLADPPEYMPVPNAEGNVVLRRIDALCAEEAIRIVRRARLNGEAMRLIVDISPASLADRSTLDPILTLLGANRAVNPDIAFAIDYHDWAELDKAESDGLATIAQQGAALAIRDTTTLRLDFAALAEKGVRYITTPASKFLKQPSSLTDFHSSDINDYIKRFGINLIVTGLETEPEILALLDDGVRLAQGRPLGGVTALRDDLRDEGNDQLRRLAAR